MVLKNGKKLFKIYKLILNVDVKLIYIFGKTLNKPNSKLL